METMFTIMLVLHIAAGFSGLTAGSFAMFLPKTGKPHKIMGNIFFYAMAVVFISSLYMSLVKSNWFLLCVGIFSFYLAASAKRILVYKTQKSFQNGPALADHLLGIGGIVAGVGMWVLAIILWSKGNTFGVVPCVFGTISAVMAFNAYRMFWKPPTQKGFWVVSHGTRMGGAYTAMVTAFIVVNMQIEQQWLLWLLPTAIIPPIFTYQIRRFLAPTKQTLINHQPLQT